MVQVQFFGLLRLLLKSESLSVPWQAGDQVQHLLARVQREIVTPFLHKLWDEDGNLHGGTLILVNRHNVHHLQGLATPVADGDVLALFPPGAGG